MTNNKEIRTIDAAMTVEQRDDGTQKIIGHAAVFNTETVVGNWFRELILPGAFAESIEKDDVRALFNHDENFVLGRNVLSKTLTLREDETGLAIEIDPPQTQLIRDLVVSPIQRRDITGMSFAFSIESSEDEIWESGKEGMLDVRKIKRAKLWDISPVTYPQYPETDVGVRSHEAWKKQEETRLQQTQDQEAEAPDESYLIDIDIKRKKLQLKEKHF